MICINTNRGWRNDWEFKKNNHLSNQWHSYKNKFITYLTEFNLVIYLFLIAIVYQHHYHQFQITAECQIPLNKYNYSVAQYNIRICTLIVLIQPSVVQLKSSKLVLIFCIARNIDVEFNLTFSWSPDQLSNQYEFSKYYKPLALYHFVKLKFAKCFCAVTHQIYF